jgi:hypothetical protein
MYIPAWNFCYGNTVLWQGQGAGCALLSDKLRIYVWLEISSMGARQSPLAGQVSCVLAAKN